MEVAVAVCWIERPLPVGSCAMLPRGVEPGRGRFPRPQALHGNLRRRRFSLLARLPDHDRKTCQISRIANRLIRAALAPRIRRARSSRQHWPGGEGSAYGVEEA